MRQRSWLLFAVLAASSFARAGDGSVFVNEFHYDNAGTDEGEAIEVAGPAGTSLNGWSLVLYNGSNGLSYATLPLAGSIPDTCGGFGALTFDAPGLQNGSPDGFALVDGTDVVQFLSYEGSFTAANGPASGAASTNVGVSEPSDSPIGQSLQLTGTGTVAADFTWQAPAASSFDGCNPGQIFQGGIDLPPDVAGIVPTDGANNVSTLPTITVTFTEPVLVATGALTLSCAASGNVGLTVQGSGASRTAAPLTALQNLESCTFAVIGSGVTDLDGPPDAMQANATSTFTTQADLAPTVAAVSPAADAGNVAITANLQVTFSEPVTTQTGWLQLSCSESGPRALDISGGPQTFHADPAGDLAGMETCTATVLAAQIVDQDGTLDAMAVDYSWSFGTAAGLGGYYDPVDASSPANLRTTLHAVIHDHSRYPYTDSTTDTWDILEQADQDPADSSRILDVYKNAVYPKQGGGNSFYDREHTWPKSYGFPDNTSTSYPHTDTHMLMLSTTSYNGARGNKPYGPCTSGCTDYATDVNNGQGGPGQANRTNVSRWETWIGKRGDVARALLYMDVRYEGGTHGITGASEPDLVLTDNAALIQTTGSNTSGTAYMGLLTTILEWHAQDPVSPQELLRNEVIQSYQGNRNPFVDHPEWANCLHLGECETTGDEIFAHGFENAPPRPD